MANMRPESILGPGLWRFQ